MEERGAKADAMVMVMNEVGCNTIRCNQTRAVDSRDNSSSTYSL